jgi:hypothetical protein
MIMADESNSVNLEAHASGLMALLDKGNTPLSSSQHSQIQMSKVQWPLSGAIHSDINMPDHG